MVQSLTFIDCSNCGKRIRSNAAKCHHCHEQNVSSNASSDLSGSGSWVNSENRERNAATAGTNKADRHSGADGLEYGEDDDFDYDEYLADEFPSHARQKPKPRVKRWVWVTAWVLVFATLLPYLYYALILTR